MCYFIQYIHNSEDWRVNLMLVCTSWVYHCFTRRWIKVTSFIKNGLLY